VEYVLNLTEPEVRRLVNHVWELEGIASITFFSMRTAPTTCSTFSRRRPSLHLTDRAGSGVRSG